MMETLQHLGIAAMGGLASLYVWVFISQLTTPGAAWLQRRLRLSFLRPLLSCPWCFGFWASLIAVLLTVWSLDAWHILLTPLAVVASAGLAGFIGSLTPGIVDEEDDRANA